MGFLKLLKKMNEERIWVENLNYTLLLRGTVLDAGAGKGNYSESLRLFPNIKEVISLDIFDPFPDTKKFLLKNWVKGSVEFLPFSNNIFDGIFCWRVMQYVQDGLQTLKEFSRALKKGGRVMIRMPIDPQGVPPSHAKPYLEEIQTGRREVLTWRVYWDFLSLEENSKYANLFPITNNYIDQTNSMVMVFEK